MRTIDCSQSLTGRRSIDCTSCQRSFSSKRGLSLHTRSCGVKSTQEAVENNKMLITDTTSEMRPAFNPLNASAFYMRATLAFNGLNDLDGAAITRKVEDAYEKMMFWRRNLFLFPTGNVSKN